MQTVIFHPVNSAYSDFIRTLCARCSPAVLHMFCWFFFSIYLACYITALFSGAHHKHTHCHFYCFFLFLSFLADSEKQTKAQSYIHILLTVWYKRPIFDCRRANEFASVLFMYVRSDVVRCVATCQYNPLLFMSTSTVLFPFCRVIAITRSLCPEQWWRTPRKNKTKNIALLSMDGVMLLERATVKRWPRCCRVAFNIRFVNYIAFNLFSLAIHRNDDADQHIKITSSHNAKY